ncbi:MAG: four helix bundle protein [Gammaproteobacteria bacterium]|nr:four helix bundle protein [Gammaproteobacteria bacterium]
MNNLKARTKKYALDIIASVEKQVGSRPSRRVAVTCSLPLDGGGSGWGWRTDARPNPDPLLLHDDAHPPPRPLPSREGGFHFFLPSLFHPLKIQQSHIIRLVRSLPRNQTADILGRQLIRSGTSVAANYRAACRARSRADFINKMGIVEEESDETQFWIELLTESGLVKPEKVSNLIKESNELIAIAVSSIKTARKK